MLEDYLWAVILGGLFCFTLGFGIGANDVANNFGTSIGSKSISLKHAFIIAAVFELVGSVGFGASVTDSVRKGVFDQGAFGAMPEFLLMANLAALISGTIWLLLASSLGLAVSSTHALMGGLTGCGLAMSKEAVHWSFLGNVVLSWIISPLLAAVVSGCYFLILRRFLLRAPNSVERGRKVLWFLLLLICWICALFFIFSNPLSLKHIACFQPSLEDPEILVKSKPCHVDKWVESHRGLAVAYSLVAGIGLAIILAPLIYWKSARDFKKAAQTRGQNYELPRTGSFAARSERSAASTDDEKELHTQPSKSHSSSKSQSVKGLGQREFETKASATKSIRTRAKNLTNRLPWNKDLHEEAYQQCNVAEELALRSEKFEPDTERFFNALQIISASMACLVHGSNDVANAAAPFASIYSIYKAEAFLDSVRVPVWVLVLGGSAISIGLLFLGHRVIRKIGIELMAISPSRGFCAEMALSTVMILGSIFGFPLSTTYVAVGAMVGIGLLDKHVDAATGLECGHRVLGLNFSAINWKLVAKMGTSWIGTIIFCGIASYLAFAYAIYSPTKLFNRFLPCDQWTQSCIKPLPQFVY